MASESEQIQSATGDFFVPIAAAYVAVCVTWLITKKLAGHRWPDEAPIETDRPWLDLGMIFVAIAGAFGLGEAYRRNLLIPDLAGPWSAISTTLNLCIPYAPIILILAIRRQNLATLWISNRAMTWKITTGSLAAVAGVMIFLALRAELARLPHVANGFLELHSWIHAPAVFLEAVAVAFVFTRLRWVCHPLLALVIPCLLFALAHVPSGIAGDRTGFEIAMFFVFNTSLAMFIFSVVMRSRDVIWIFIPHFVLDMAIEAFG